MACVVGNKSKDIARDGNPSKYCGVSPTLFGCFLWIHPYMSFHFLNAFL